MRRTCRSLIIVSKNWSQCKISKLKSSTIKNQWSWIATLTGANLASSWLLSLKPWLGSTAVNSTLWKSTSTKTKQLLRHWMSNLSQHSFCSIKVRFLTRWLALTLTSLKLWLQRRWSLTMNQETRAPSFNSSFKQRIILTRKNTKKLTNACKRRGLTSSSETNLEDSSALVWPSARSCWQKTSRKLWKF